MHNEKEVTPTPRIRLTNNVRLDDKNNDTIVTSVLHITKLLEEDTGLVQVIGKYGTKDMRSPTVTAQMILDVQCKYFL